MAFAIDVRVEFKCSDEDFGGVLQRVLNALGKFGALGSIDGSSSGGQGVVLFEISAFLPDASSRIQPSVSAIFGVSNVEASNAGDRSTRSRAVA